MKRKLIFLLIALLIPASAFAWWIGMFSGISWSYDYSTNFDTTTEPSPESGWSETGDPNWDQAAPAGMSGEVLSCGDNIAGYKAVINSSATHYYNVKLYATANPGVQEQIIFIKSAGGTGIGYIWIDTSGNLGAQARNGTLNWSAISITTATKTVKFSYYNAGGSGSTVVLYNWNGSSWDTIATSNDGDQTSNGDRLDLLNDAATTIYYDDYAEDDDDITVPYDGS